MTAQSAQHSNTMIKKTTHTTQENTVINSLSLSIHAVLECISRLCSKVILSSSFFFNMYIDNLQTKFTQNKPKMKMMAVWFFRS